MTNPKTLHPTVDEEELRPFEEQVLDAVGDTIEFWGFKRNQGRVWAFLYLRQRPFDAAALMRILGLSKGAVSMLTRDLLRYKCIRRVRVKGSSSMHYEAQTDVREMISGVIKEREQDMVRGVKARIEQARDLASDDDSVAPGEVERIERMLALATLVEQAIKLFLTTAQVDVSRSLDVLELAAFIRKT